MVLRANREKTGLFTLEGPKVINEAFEKGIKINDVIVSRTYLKDGLANFDQSNVTAINVVEDKVFEKLATTTTSCGVIAVGAMRQYKLEDCLKGATPLVVVGEAIQDPGNAGTLIRSAQAFGATGVILTKGSVDPYNPKVVRSAMGALFSVPVVVDVKATEALDQLRKRDIKVYALDAKKGARGFWEVDVKEPIALVFGNEGHGFDPETLLLATDIVTIPITDLTESLNVAVSASIVLFHCYKVRSH